MSKVSTNISLDADLKKSAQSLFADLGLDMTTAVTLFLRQSVREQAIPFEIRRVPNRDTAAAMDEYVDMKAHPDTYRHYSSFSSALDEVMHDA